VTTIAIRRIALCALLVAAAGCTSKSPPPPPPPPPTPAPLPSGTLDAQLLTATATVKKIDLKTRKVTIERPDGSVVTVTAGPEVRNLAQVKVGDVIRVSYYESIAYAVRKAGEATPGVAVAEDARRAQPGERPAAAGASVVTVTTTITGIDKQAGTVTLTGPDGNSTTIKARDPRNLDRVAVGDLVEITFTEAVAIAVETPAKQ
jgi:Cu/Ag efflux protein CusF